MTRREVLSNAVTECLKELYSWATPKIDWEEFLKENKIYTEKYTKWKVLENRPPILEYCGPRPYEFYYLPSDIFNDIKESYVYAYKLDGQKELLDTIEILKNYCKEPIVDKYIEGKEDEPGHRGYDHPDNLIEEIRKILIKYDDHMDSEISEEVVNKFFEFLDMAGNFFNWNGDLNSFYMSVCLGASPNSNKQAVIDNWKKYRNKTIEIDDSEYDNEEQDYD